MTDPFNPGDIVCLVEWPGKTAKVIGVTKSGLVAILDRPLDGFRNWNVNELKHAPPPEDQDQ